MTVDTPESIVQAILATLPGNKPFRVKQIANAAEISATRTETIIRKFGARKG